MLQKKDNMTCLYFLYNLLVTSESKKEKKTITSRRYEQIYNNENNKFNNPDIKCIMNMAFFFNIYNSLSIKMFVP